MQCVRATYTRTATGEQIPDVIIPIFDISEYDTYLSICTAIAQTDPTNGAATFVSAVMGQGASCICGGRSTTVGYPSDGTAIPGALCFGYGFIAVRGLAPSRPNYAIAVSSPVADTLTFSDGTVFTCNDLGITSSVQDTFFLPCIDLTNFSSAYVLQTSYSSVSQSVALSNNGIYDINAGTYWILALKNPCVRNMTAPRLSRWQTVLTNNPPEPVPPFPDDPYEPGGETEPGGGEGDFDDNTEPIEFSEDPQLSAVDTGFITLFNPSLAQLNDLANYMWGSVFDLENWKKLFANPMDAILGLSIVPVAVPNGGASSVKVGNIDTGVSMTKAASQYVNVDCGTLNVKEFWGAYLDYSPYTKAEIFLPFIGAHPLDIDDIMKKSVHVKYKVDILSGACIAQIKCGDAVLYSFSGQCAATIPVTGRDWTNVVGSALSIVGNVAGAAITGGMTAPSAAVNVAQAVTNVIKPNIQKSGNVAGMAGIMGIQKPYLILTRPRQAVPKNQNRYTGYPSFITAKLSKCDGYTEIENVHLEGIPGTSEELNEIDRLLRNGVIF